MARLEKLQALVLTITDEDMRLLKREVLSGITSYAYPQGTLDADQPTEWHQAKTLEQFAAKIARLRALARTPIR